MSYSRSTTILFVLLAMIGTAGLIPASADTGVSHPLLPQTFSGVIYVGGAPAESAFPVEAAGDGVIGGLPGNPVTSRVGSYGSSSPFDGTRLIVQGDIPPGTPIYFFVGGLPADVSGPGTNGLWQATYPFASGENTELHLRIASQPPAGQTREPTPVRTITGSQNAGGPILPQVPGSVITPAESGSTGSSSAGDTGGIQPGPGQKTASPTGGAAGAAEAGTGSTSFPVLGSSTILTAGFLVVVLVVFAAAYTYRSLRDKRRDEEEEE